MISWKPVQGAAYHKVTIASDENLSRNVSTYNTHNTTFTPDTFPKAAQSGSGIYVRVVVYDNQNNVGQYLMEPRFVPRPAVPEVARITLPVVIKP
ncbi:MAG TPA: hypothetical protein GX714_09650 [Chloroflexi bacterium]|nr:hypothetical protein [Chloroflexota bacterium]